MFIVDLENFSTITGSNLTTANMAKIPSTYSKGKQIMKILMIIYDNDSHISYFPLGPAYVASAIRASGHNVEIYNQDVYHYTENHLVEFLKHNHFDAVGIGACGGYYQYGKVKKICDAINTLHENRPVIILGGHMASADPKYFLNYMQADFVSIGESEITMVELLNALENIQFSSHSLSFAFDHVDGIAFMRGNEYIETPRRELIENIDNILFPAYDLFPMEHYVLYQDAYQKRSDRTMTILSGRGCIYKCNFCYRMDKGFRPRSAESILKEITYLQTEYSINHISFIDELLMSSKERTINLCRTFIDSGLQFTWNCAGRLNFATPDVLMWMKKAGCVFISYGMEAVDDIVLKNMNKVLTVEQMTRGVESTQAAGIRVGFNFIFGNIGETADVLEKDVEFLLKYDDHAQLRTIRPVTPYPGSPLYYYCIENGLLKDCDDFYKKHVNSDLLTVNLTNMSDDEYYKTLKNANQKLLSNYISSLNKQHAKILEELYDNKNAEFRGFRQV